MRCGQGAKTSLNTLAIFVDVGAHRYQHHTEASLIIEIQFYESIAQAALRGVVTLVDTEGSQLHTTFTKVLILTTYRI